MRFYNTLSCVFCQVVILKYKNMFTNQDIHSMPKTFGRSRMMSRNNTKAIKSINRMYEQMNLSSEDILHKTKLLLSVYRDVVWATLHSDH